MNYLWQEFNIKTFPAETIVFRDGIYQSELSTLPNDLKITKKYDLPVHIIYVGEVAGKNDINCEISAENQQVFLSAKITIKKPAFLNVFIKNTGKNSNFNGKFLIHNFSELEINEKAGYFAENTGIFIENRVVARANTRIKISGVAEINKGFDFCKSDLSFSAIAAPDAQIEFNPEQRIKAVPMAANHSAFVWHGSEPQIQYLRLAGLSGDDVKKVLEEAFTNGFV